MLVDMDYQLQLLAAGCSTLRFLELAFTFVTPTRAKGGYTSLYKDEVERKKCIQEFLDLHPEIEPGMKKLSNGIWVCKNIRNVWRQYRYNNVNKIPTLWQKRKK